MHMGRCGVHGDAYTAEVVDGVRREFCPMCEIVSLRAQLASVTQMRQGANRQFQLTYDQLMNAINDIERLRNVRAMSQECVIVPDYRNHLPNVLASLSGEVIIGMYWFDINIFSAWHEVIRHGESHDLFLCRRLYDNAKLVWHSSHILDFMNRTT